MFSPSLLRVLPCQLLWSLRRTAEAGKAACDALKDLAAQPFAALVAFSNKDLAEIRRHVKKNWNSNYEHVSSCWWWRGGRVSLPG